jgi:2-polyprenyl-6-hydroxyphenyl methylase / 3-demethylubiquinone-9 3-methyltransferase
MERKKNPHKPVINNSFYDGLMEKWYSASDHPIALLRAENEVRAPWIMEELEKRSGKNAKILDVGCGAGFLTNPLAKRGFNVTGIDISNDSLLVAKEFDQTKKVNYLYGSAYELPFKNASFDAVSALDVIEHVENPAKLISEASRVLKPNGLFFFHTFNQNLLSYLMIIKGVAWFVKNAPDDMHVYHLFVSPKKLSKLCLSASLKVETLRGLRPQMDKAFWKMVFSGTIPDNFRFRFCKSLLTGYVGIAKKI